MFNLGYIEEGSLGEKLMLDRITRLMNHQAVGRLECYTKGTKPDDMETVRPKDSILSHDELTEFMKLDTVFYEKKLPEGKTDLYLCDPSQDEEAQLKELMGKFPNTLLYDSFSGSYDESTHANHSDHVFGASNITIWDMPGMDD